MTSATSFSIIGGVIAVLIIAILAVVFVQMKKRKGTRKAVRAALICLLAGILLFGLSSFLFRDTLDVFQGNYIRPYELTEQEKETFEKQLPEGSFITDANVFDFKVKGSRKVSISSATYRKGVLESQQDWGSLALANKSGSFEGQGKLFIRIEDSTFSVGIAKDQNYAEETWPFELPELKKQKLELTGSALLGEKVPVELGKARPVGAFFAGSNESTGSLPEEGTNYEPLYQNTEYAFVVYVTFK